MKLKPAKVPARADDSKLTAEEITELRSALGALLWITAARARATMAEIKDLKTANLVVEKVKQYADAGLHYRILQVLRGGAPEDRLCLRRDATMLKKEFW